MQLTFRILGLSVLFTLLPFSGISADRNRTWTDPERARQEDPDFSIQGEYGSDAPGATVGVQVIAMGQGTFEARLFESGLPGLGWTRGKARTLLKGRRDGNNLTLASADQKVSATIHGGKMILKRDGKETVTLPRVERRSPTLGAKPPQGAVILFDGTSAGNWKNGKMENGLLAATGCMSRQGFRNYSLHLEFRTPYKPDARGQGRGNSGVYYGGRWETQVLDSFGLEGRENECGGLYSIAEPLLNMCLPPLTWQTYDVDFTAAKFDGDGNRVTWPRITVRLNGVVIHQDQELAKNNTTAAPIGGPIKDEPGPIFLQDHGNPVFFRNIWVKEKD